MRLAILATTVLAGLLLTTAARAQVKWTFSTEYPASNISGVGLATFAALVEQRATSKIEVSTIFDGANGLSSGQMIAAARDGRITGGDAFAGVLEATDPVFGLASLPFVSHSTEAAQRLNNAARPHYRRALDEQGLKLLYVTIWPATGLWSDRPLNNLADLRAMSIRAYDANSAEVMHNLGAKAESLPLNTAVSRVKAHELNAILSSGDGGAGRKLWDDLPHFTALNYAVPISVAFMRQTDFAALPPELQTIVDGAAAETEARQFALLADRTERNYAQMRANGVTIRTTVPDDVGAALVNAARPVIQAWSDRASPEARALLPP